MIRVRVFDYYQHAEYYFNKFLEEHIDEILVAKKQRAMTIWTKNGDELHFVPISVFDDWQRGRTYTLEQWGTLDEVEHE